MSAHGLMTITKFVGRVRSRPAINDPGEAMTSRADFKPQWKRGTKMPNTLQTVSSRSRRFLAVAEAAAPRRLDGETLKFSKGEWLAGKDANLVPTGTELVAIMDTLTVGWIKWSAGRPVDYRMGLAVDGFSPPRR